MKRILFFLLVSSIGCTSSQEKAEKSIHDFIRENYEIDTYEPISFKEVKSVNINEFKDIIKEKILAQEKVVEKLKQHAAEYEDKEDHSLQEENHYIELIDNINEFVKRKEDYEQKLSMWDDDFKGKVNVLYHEYAVDKGGRMKVRYYSYFLLDTKYEVIYEI